ncbi:hypothetical protein Bca4012_037100 [Brassica carinata]
MIPKFNNLSRLEAVFHSDLLQSLPAFLECCTNLKHLVLVKHAVLINTWMCIVENLAFCAVCEGCSFRGDGGRMELTDVPRCVSSTLECVEIKDKFEWEEGKMKVASYFVENSAVLKRLILSLTVYNQNIYDKVNQLIKRSTGCQIIHE